MTEINPSSRNLANGLEDPVDFFAGAFERPVKECSSSTPPTNEQSQGRSKRNMLGKALVIAAAAVATYKVGMQDTARTVLRDATAILDKDASITHGQNDPAIARQRAAIAADRSPDVLAFSNAEAPDSTMQTSCAPYEIQPNDSPWGVAEYYARLYGLGEKKLRALEQDIARAVGGEQDMQLDDGSFTICVRTPSPLPAQAGN